MTSPAPSPDALLHLATLHILSSAGFPSTSRAASLTLSSIAAKYIRTIAQACTEQAALAGRSKVGAGDVVEVLDDMGQGVGGLEEWFVGLDVGREGSFVGGLEELGAQLREGMELPDALAELKIVHNDEIPLDYDDSGEETMAEDNDEEEDSMEVDPDDMTPPVKTESIDHKPYDFIRAQSPDFSWLPPLPGQSHEPTSDIHPSSVSDPLTTATAQLPILPSTVSTAKLSLIEKYRTRQTYSSSSLASSNFLDPPIHPSPSDIPAPTSSFPALLSAYKAIAGEPSVSLNQTPLRQQAADLLRRVIAPPDMYGVSDTLSGPIPAPAGRILSASTSDTLPPPTLQVNPNSTGILTRLVKEMRSPYLPPTLRDRLITLRPPLALHDEDGRPVYYGEPVRGPDIGTLNKARGKPSGGLDGEGEDEKNTEAYYRYTWDAGPRGVEKWGKGSLPTGKKVFKRGQGEDTPRTSDKKLTASTGIKLRLDRSPTTLTPGAGGGVSPGGTGMNWGEYNVAGHSSSGPSASFAGYSEGREKKPGSGTSISLRLPSPATSAGGMSGPLSAISPHTVPQPTLRISTSSLSPNPGPSTSGSTNLEVKLPRITLSPNTLSQRESTSPGRVQESSVPPVQPKTGTSGGFKIRLGVKKESDA